MRRRDLLVGAAFAATAAIATVGAPGDAPVRRAAAQTGTLGDARRYLAAFRDWRRAQETRAEYLPQVEEAAFTAANAMRAEAGRQPLAQEETLRWIARFYAARLAASGDFAHEDEAGRGPAERTAILHRRHVGLSGENIFKSDIFTLSEQPRAGRFAVDSLMESPGHRRNILAPDWTHAAVGAVADGDVFHLVQLFGRRAALLAADAPLEVPAGRPLPDAFSRFADGGAERLAIVAPGGDVSGADLLPFPEARAPARTGAAATRYAVRDSAEGDRIAFSVFPGPAIVVV